MKYLFFLSAILSIQLITSYRDPDELINPTGTYILKGMMEKNVITGPNGEIRAKLLDNNKLALCFFINKGYPGFESGSFIDTLDYNDNQVKYRSQKDADCTIVLVFKNRYVDVMLIHSDPQCTCGFVKGVMIPASFEKCSGDNPIIQDLAHRAN